MVYIAVEDDLLTARRPHALYGHAPGRTSAGRLHRLLRPLDSPHKTQQPRYGRIFLRQAIPPPASDPETPSQDVGQLLTVTETCARLRVSRWTLQQLINRRQIRTIKIGSRRLVPQSAIAQLIKRLSDEESL